MEKVFDMNLKSKFFGPCIMIATRPLETNRAQVDEASLEEELEEENTGVQACLSIQHGAHVKFEDVNPCSSILYDVTREGGNKPYVDGLVRALFKDAKEKQQTWKKKRSYSVKRAAEANPTDERDGDGFLTTGRRRRADVLESSHHTHQ
jgi:hypothetical protein